MIQDVDDTETGLSAVDAAASFGLFGLSETECESIGAEFPTDVKLLDDESKLSELKDLLKIKGNLADGGGQTRQDERLDSSIRSHEAIIGFADDLAVAVRKVGHQEGFLNISVGSCIVAVNKDYAKVSQQDNVVAGLTIWSREFLEPTIGMVPKTKGQAKRRTKSVTKPKRKRVDIPT